MKFTSIFFPASESIFYLSKIEIGIKQKGLREKVRKLTKAEWGTI